jgi:glycosyltransferase involved in cell wall biosynthesis
MDSDQKLVSIGIPTYNRPEELRRTLECLTNQTYKNLEIIVSDNCSTGPETENVVREFVARDQRVQYFRQENNKGVAFNFNFVFKQAKGEYFMWAGDDDWYDKNFISTLEKALNENPRYGVAMSSLNLVYGDKQVAEKIIYDKKNNVSYFNHDKIFFKCLDYSPPLHFFILGLWRIDLFKKIIDYPVAHTIGGDQIMICEASFMTYFYSTPQILFEKTIYKKGSRRGEYYEIYHSTGKSTTDYCLALCQRILTSPNISLYQKVSTVPIKICFVLWNYKRTILLELFPFLKNIKKYFKSGKK